MSKFENFCQVVYNSCSTLDEIIKIIDSEILESKEMFGPNISKVEDQNYFHYISELKKYIKIGDFDESTDPEIRKWTIRLLEKMKNS